MIGSTPGGLISYISPAYGGAVSDRQVIERSGLPTACDARDSVMADKGFNVQDLFAPHDVQVNIPTLFTIRCHSKQSARDNYFRLNHVLPSIECESYCSS